MAAAQQRGKLLRKDGRREVLVFKCTSAGAACRATAAIEATVFGACAARTLHLVA